MGANPGHWVHDRGDTIREPTTEFGIARKIAYRNSQEGRDVLPEASYAQVFVPARSMPPWPKNCNAVAPRSRASAISMPRHERWQTVRGRPLPAPGRAARETAAGAPPRAGGGIALRAPPRAVLSPRVQPGISRTAGGTAAIPDQPQAPERGAQARRGTHRSGRAGKSGLDHRGIRRLHGARLPARHLRAWRQYQDPWHRARRGHRP